jgi:hypothetical protein
MENVRNGKIGIGQNGDYITSSTHCLLSLSLSFQSLALELVLISYHRDRQVFWKPLNEEGPLKPLRS